MKTRHLVLTIAIALTVAVLVAPAVEARADPDLVVILRGPGSFVPDPPVEVDDQGEQGDVGCFEADLFDAKTNRKIGTGIDCLDVLDDTGGLSINRTTIFNLPRGRLVARGQTSVVPKTTGSPLYTHIVGDVDDSIPGGNIESEKGTRRYRGRTGNVRLSGIVDLVNFIQFNCVFVIDLD